MVKIKFHGQGGYASGTLNIFLRRGDVIVLDEQKYKKFRKDIGETRFRSECEILSPASKRTVREYFDE